MMLIFMSSAGILTFLSILIPQDQDNVITWRTFLSIIITMCSKTLATAVVGSSYVFTYRLYPASVRNTLYALCSSIAKIGSLSAPLINTLKTLLWSPLPNIIFSSSSLIATMILVTLPDPSKINWVLWLFNMFLVHVYPKTLVYSIHFKKIISMKNGLDFTF